MYVYILDHFGSMRLFNTLSNVTIIRSKFEKGRMTLKILGN